ncbi:MAG: hypothetical protein BRC44_05910, partial [Cyanobacteria bacterium QS_4_48_99]
MRRGERKKNVSQMWLNISGNTLDWWLKREETTGDCRAITNYQYQQGGRQKIMDWQGFGEFLPAPPGISPRAARAAALWTREAVSDLIRQQWGVKLFQKAVGNYLRPWGLSPQKPAQRS